MANDIRSYGPGKFSTIVDSYVYSVSLDGGCDEESGSVDENGHWYGLMRHGSTIFRDHDPSLESLNDAERELLTSCAGVIIREDSDGFVCVDYIATNEELDRKWAAIESEMAEFYGSEDSTEDEQKYRSGDDPDAWYSK